MRIIKLIIATMLMAGASTLAEAQQPYPPYPYYQPQHPPPSWYYNPYTSGLGPCPQRGRGDTACQYRIDPSYGQPSFWPTPR